MAKQAGLLGVFRLVEAIAVAGDLDDGGVVGEAVDEADGAGTRPSPAMAFAPVVEVAAPSRTPITLNDGKDHFFL